MNAPSASTGTNVEHTTAFSDSFYQRIDGPGNVWKTWSYGCRDTAILLVQNAAQLGRGYTVNAGRSWIPILSLETPQLNSRGWHIVHVRAVLQTTIIKETKIKMINLSNVDAPYPRKTPKYNMRNGAAFHAVPWTPSKGAVNRLPHLQTTLKASFFQPGPINWPSTGTNIPGSERYRGESCLIEVKYSAPQGRQRKFDVQQPATGL